MWRSSQPALALLLAGCAVGRVETERTAAGAPVAVAERVAAELTGLGFRQIERTDGAIAATAGSVAENWATCSPVLVGAGDDRRRMATAGQERGTVRITLAPAGDGTAVAADARFVASYRNTGTGYSFERACRTTGELERLLLAAAAG